MNLTKSRVAGLMMAATFSLASGAAGAGQCGYDYCWGAVGIGADGSWSWSTDNWSEDDAISNVQRECGYNCETIRTFYNTCGAMAQASNGGWGFGWANNRGQAEANAMDYCWAQGPNCQVRVWACSL